MKDKFCVHIHKGWTGFGEIGYLFIGRDKLKIISFNSKSYVFVNSFPNLYINTIFEKDNLHLIVWFRELKTGTQHNQIM